MRYHQYRTVLYVLFTLAFIASTIPLQSCKKCKTCSSVCRPCRVTRGPYVGLRDTLCSEDFASYQEYYDKVVVGDSLDCLGAIPSSDRKFSSCNDNAKGAYCE
jgi:hypothetical protein